MEIERKSTKKKFRELPIGTVFTDDRGVFYLKIKPEGVYGDDHRFWNAVQLTEGGLEIGELCEFGDGDEVTIFNCKLVEV
jgi:hypothetical protein